MQETTKEKMSINVASVTQEVDKDNNLKNEDNNQANKPQRKVYLDHIRNIAAFMVIAIHVISNFVNHRGVSYGTTAWYIDIILDNFMRVAVPLYVMISGALFLDENKKITTKKLLLHYVLRLVVIFFLWAFIYEIFEIYYMKQTWRKPIDIILAVARGDYHYHLWFLPMIIGLYLITPLLRCICKKENKKLVEYFLIIYIVSVGIISMLASKEFGIIPNTIFDFANLLTPTTLANYVGLYVLGWYLSTFDHSKKFVIIVMSIGFTLYAIGGVTDILYSHSLGKAAYMSSSNIGIFKIAASSAIFISLRYSKWANKENKFIRYLSDCNFGIYLTHAIIRNLVFKLFGVKYALLAKTGWAIVLMPTYCLVMFILSFAVTALIRLLPKKVNRWIV